MEDTENVVTRNVTGSPGQKRKVLGFGGGRRSSFRKNSNSATKEKARKERTVVFNDALQIQEITPRKANGRKILRDISNNLPAHSQNDTVEKKKQHVQSGSVALHQQTIKPIKKITMDHVWTTGEYSVNIEGRMRQLDCALHEMDSAKHGDSFFICHNYFFLPMVLWTT